MIYYSNSISFINKELEDKCRVTNKFFEFMQSNSAKEIEIEVNAEDNVCLHVFVFVRGPTSAEPRL